MSEGGSQTLSHKFDALFQEFSDIENSSLPSNDEGNQKKISELILKYEEITLIVSQIGLFSSNEKIDEISTSSVKFLLLPYFLGCLTLKKCKSCREEDVKIASIYFRDFIQRCRSYEITTISIPLSQVDGVDGKEKSKPSQSISAKEDLAEMSRQREQKIKRFKEKKQLEEKVKYLNQTIKNSNQVDEETLRDYYLTMIQQYCYISLEELNSLELENKMLLQMKLSKEAPPTSESSKPELKPFRPFLLTRNETQKQVFGAGYPSLPSMTVEEFYEQRVKEGLFPAKNSHERQTLKTPTQEGTNNKNSDDCDPEDDPEQLSALRNRDEWRDMHRRGWGNTYNRS